MAVGVCAAVSALASYMELAPSYYCIAPKRGNFIECRLSTQGAHFELVLIKPLDGLRSQCDSRGRHQDTVFRIEASDTSSILLLEIVHVFEAETLNLLPQEEFGTEARNLLLLFLIGLLSGCWRGYTDNRNCKHDPNRAHDHYSLPECRTWSHLDRFEDY
jgi:hypothetical protein